MSLLGRTIIVTRTQRQAGAFSSLLEARGARVLEIPTIEIEPIAPDPLSDYILNLGVYDWLFFTSVNAVEIFFRRLPAGSRLPRICSIGPSTSDRIRAFGGDVALQPDLYQAEGIIEEFTRHCGRDGIEGLKVLLPRARVARETLPERLRELGATVDVVPLYDTVIPQTSRRALETVLQEGEPDLITFTSSSTVRHFMELAEGLAGVETIPCAVIGPITEATARENQLQIVCRAEKSTIPDFVDAIERYFGKVAGLARP